MKIGSKIKVQAYKHDGSLHSVSEEATILEITNEMIVCANKETIITEGDGRSYKTNETALLFFFKKNWFNIICQFKKYGIFYYCNIASPYLIDGNIIKYIDYDLDLRVFPDGEYKILDKNEYQYHKRKMNYSLELDEIVKFELEKLVEMKKNNKFPFKKEDIEEYKRKFIEIKKQKKTL